jgi:hypothetical protein
MPVRQENGTDLDALAALVAELRARTLPEHGGPAGPLLGWNLTRGDSEMHKRSADAITALIARVRAQEAALDDCERYIRMNRDGAKKSDRAAHDDDLAIVLNARARGSRG